MLESNPDSDVLYIQKSSSSEQLAMTRRGSIPIFIFAQATKQQC